MDIHMKNGLKLIFLRSDAASLFACRHVLHPFHHDELWCKDAFSFPEQQVIATASSLPVLLVRGCWGHVSPRMCVHEADNVTVVGRKYAPERGLECRAREKYFPCHKEPYQNVIFITSEGNVPLCIRWKSDLMWCTAACQKQCYLGQPGSPICSVF